MMNRHAWWVALVALVLCCSLGLLTGCATKGALKSEAAVASEQRVGAQAPAVTAPADDSAARAKALRDKELADAAAREAAEKAAREAAERAKREAAERAKREAAERAAAILKELQVADIYFDFDKYNLKPEAQATLKAAAPAYLKYTDYKVVVEGHCDERGTVEYNLALGQKRADETAKFLTDLGIQKDRVKTISYGKEMPLEKGHDEAAWTKNRRAHFVVFPPVAK